MNRRVAIEIAIAGVLGFAVTARSRAASSNEPENVLRGLQDRWAKARIDGDAAFLETLYAKEFRIQAMNGAIVERDADIALFAARPRVLKPDSIVDTDMRVSVYGEAALVTGVENLKGSYKDRYREMSLRFTNVFVQRDGRWQLVAHQSTRMRRT